MIEKIKTSVLFGLVILSLLLTSKLWSDIPTNRKITGADSTVPVFYDYKMEAEDILKPPYIWINLDNNIHTKVYANTNEYDNVWSNVKEIVTDWANGQNMQFTRISKDDWIQTQAEILSIKYTSPIRLSKEVIKELFPSADIPKELINSEEVVIVPGTQTAILFRNENEYFRALTGTEKGNVLREKIISTARNQVNQYIQLPSNIAGIPVDSIIFVPVITPLLEEFLVQVIDVKPEDLARTFFADISLARKINERNGAIVFIDGQRGLRIFPNGAVEFNRAVLGTPDKRNGDNHIEIMTSFVNNHGGWVENLSIHRVDRFSAYDQNTYLIKYGINGIQIRGIQKLLEITIEENQIRDFYRLYHGIKGKGEKYPIISATEALDILVPILREYPTVRGNSITSVELCYIWRQSGDDTILTPGWVIRYGDVDFYINGITGKYMP
jgi:regulatory protein YycH of two-component signal transduction system YycFG